MLHALLAVDIFLGLLKSQDHVWGDQAWVIKLKDFVPDAIKGRGNIERHPFALTIGLWRRGPDMNGIGDSYILQFT